MKRILVVFLASVMLVGMTACGTNEVSVDKTTKGTVASEVETKIETQIQTEASTEDPMLVIVDAAKYVEKVLGDDLNNYYRDVDSSMVHVSYYAEDIKTDFELNVTFDGINIEEGTPVKEIIDAGYEMKTPNIRVRGEDFISFSSFENKSKGTEITLEIYNSESEERLAKDCTISGFTIDKSIDSAEYCGLTSDSSLEDVFEKYGPSEEIHVGEYSKDEPYISLVYFKVDENDDYHSLTINLSYDGTNSSITRIHYD